MTASKFFNFQNNKIIPIKYFTKNNAILACSKSGTKLAYVCEELRDDFDVVFKAVKNEGASLIFASRKLKKNKQIVFEAVKNSPNSFQYSDESLRGDEDIIIEALKEPSNISLVKLDQEKLKNEIFCLKILSSYPRFYLDLDNILKNDINFIKKAVTANAIVFEYLSEKNRNIFEIALIAIKKDPAYLRNVGDILKDNEEIVKVAISNNLSGHLYTEASERLRSKIELFELAVQHCSDYMGSVIDAAPPQFLKNKKIIENLLKTSKYENIFDNLHDLIKKDNKLMSLAISAHGENARALDEESKNNIDVMSVVCKIDALQCVESIGDKLRDSVDMAIMVLKEDADFSLLNFFSDRIRSLCLNAKNKKEAINILNNEKIKENKNNLDKKIVKSFKLESNNSNNTNNNSPKSKI